MERESHARKEKEVGEVYSQMFGQAEQRLQQKAKIEDMIQQGKTEEGLVFENPSELGALYEEAKGLGIEVGPLRFTIGMPKEKPAVETPTAMAA